MASLFGPTGKLPVSQTEEKVLPLSQPSLTEFAMLIRGHMETAVQSVVSVGRILTQARDMAGDGTFLSWVRSEFGWSPSTAQRYMRVYRAFSGIPEDRFSALPARALYALSSPDVSPDVRERVLSQIERTKGITAREVVDIMDAVREKGAQTPPPPSVVRHLSEGPPPRTPPPAERETPPPPVPPMFTDHTGRTVPPEWADLYSLAEEGLGPIIRHGTNLRAAVEDLADRLEEWRDQYLRAREGELDLRAEALWEVVLDLRSCRESLWGDPGESPVLGLVNWAANLLPYQFDATEFPFPWLNRAQSRQVHAPRPPAETTEVLSIETSTPPDDFPDGLF